MAERKQITTKEYLAEVKNGLEHELSLNAKALPENFNQSRFVLNCISLIKSNLGNYNNITPESVYLALAKGAYLGLDFFNGECYAISTAELVTRVRVIGKADDEGQSSVEATLNGLTKYGIRQRIYTRGSDESLDDAKTAAQEILDDKGSPDEQITLSAPDVPYIRKGDLVYVMAGVSDNYYYVNGIRHDCETSSMTMELELAKTETVKENQTESKKEYKVGDIVNFHGGTHYVSSYSGSKGYNARAGKAKITIANGSGKAHPWHLIHTDSSSNVYGWVDDGTFD